MYLGVPTGTLSNALRRNTLSPGDRILMVETGHFAKLWQSIAIRHGLQLDFVPTDWRRGVDPAIIEEKLTLGCERAIKAVAIVHNETSTDVTQGPRVQRERARSR